MELSSGTHIPDGLLAATALLNENPRLGFQASACILHPDFELANSLTAQWDSRSVAAELRWTHQTARFMSPDFNDSGDKPEPVPYADLTNPQSLNLYSYVNNNPLSNTDDDGHSCDGGAVGPDGTTTFHCQNDPPTPPPPPPPPTNPEPFGNMAMVAAVPIIELAPETLGASLLAGGFLLGAECLQTNCGSALASLLFSSQSKPAVSDTGGGKNAQKSNPDKQASAEGKLDKAKADLDAANKMPPSKERSAAIQQAKKTIKHWQGKVHESSENHSQQGKGQQQ